MKVDQFIAWHASVLPSGDVVRCDRRGNVPSCEIAKARLRFVIRADREACPTWRWVEARKRFRGIAAWDLGTVMVITKRCLRWERRR